MDGHSWCIFEVERSKLKVKDAKIPKSFFTVSKGKGKGLDTCYSAASMCQTRDQQRFTISELAADWHEPVVPQRIIWPSIATLTDNWTHGAASRHTIAPISHTSPSPRSRSYYLFQLATCSRLLAVDRVWVEPATSRLRVRYSTTTPLHPPCPPHMVRFSSSADDNVPVPGRVCLLCLALQIFLCRSIYLGIIVGLIVFVITDICVDTKRLTSFAGMMLLLLLGFLTSNNPSKVSQVHFTSPDTSSLLTYPHFFTSVNHATHCSRRLIHIHSRCPL